MNLKDGLKPKILRGELELKVLKMKHN